MPPSREEQKLVQHRVARDLAIARLNDIKVAAKEANDDVSKHTAFRARYQTVENIYKSFEAFHAKIVSIVSLHQNRQLLQDEDEVRLTSDQIYFEIKATYYDLFQAQNDSSNHTNRLVRATASNAKLQKISLPCFGGDLSTWNNFVDLFSALVDENSTLTGIEKFQYLISCLSGEALAIVKGVSLSSDNYSIAFESLKKRYNNKRLLATSFWKKIVSVPRIDKENISLLRQLINIFSENLAALDNLGFPCDQWCFPLFNILLDKIDLNTRTRFEFEYREVNLPTYEQLISFLSSHCKAMENIDTTKNIVTVPKQNISSNSPKVNSKTNFKSFVVNTDSLRAASIAATCAFCKKDHFNFKCPSFLEKNPHDRYLMARNHRLCLNCLRPSHNVKNCTSSSRCRACNFSHHTLLHFEKKPIAENNLPEVSLVQPSSSIVHTGLVNNTLLDTTILLSTVEVNILNSFGSFIKVRALIDNGSQASFITEKCLRRLGLRHLPMSQPIHGIGSSLMVHPKGQTNCTIRPVHTDGPQICFQAFILSSICADMPNYSFSAKTWPHISNLQLADPHFYMSQPIDMLLSAEVFAQILCNGKIEGGPHEPVALNTKFGWILTGRIQCQSLLTSRVNSFVTSLHISNDSLQSLDTTLKNFWTLEDIPQAVLLSPADLQCEEFYKKTTYRNNEGRYVVSLPFSSGSLPDLGNSRESALRRFYSLENRLSKNSDLKKQYSDFMHDYIDSGHMSPNLSLDNLSGAYYIPHHCVIRTDSNTTKLRVVFDASSKSSSGNSLNDTILTGPKLQTDIATLLCHFRTHSIVFTADIRQMYRQILIAPHHRTYQRILWRFSVQDIVQEFFLNTVTYGVNVSPFLALRTLRQLCNDEGHRFPLAAKFLEEDTYVDDIFGGCETEEEANLIVQQLIGLLACAGFELRKWASNKPILLGSIPESFQQLPIDFEEDSVIKILGLRWNPSKDTFSYKVNVVSNECTKRSILSELARIFDPLGFLTPLTFFAKRLMQLLWTLGLDWDDVPSSDIQSQWNQYKSELPCLSSLEIPRHIIHCKVLSCQVHGFCDASERGYAAVVYLRFQEIDGNFSVFLVSAKSKVSPLKLISIPRLELCAAVLLADLIAFVSSTYKDRVKIEQIFAWSDSTVVLNWIRSPPYRWKTFVGNRVSLIHNKTNPSNWYHVAGKENPADIASRGVLPSELVHNPLWWAGPPWLSSIDLDSKIAPSLSPCEESLSEERRCTLNISVQFHPILSLLDRFSSLEKIQRIVVYCLKFLARLFGKKPDFLIYSIVTDDCRVITPTDLSISMLVIVRIVQHSAFCDEISRVEKGLPCSKSLRKLCPFLDKDKLLRVGGRLVNSKLSYDQKFPLLLPRQHRFTELIIQNFHERYLHPGLRTLQFLISQQFWILSPRRAIRHVLSKCHRCFRINPVSIEPLMGNLPAQRVSQVKPFSHVGCDFGGPFLITLGKTRGSKSQKAYLCLFVCFATKAVHLELASDLSSDCFLAAFRRFIARRGRCSKVYSDCGTNFVGAHKYLQDIMKQAVETEKIEWHFNPPSASHFGGLWESGIKSVKSHLVRVVGEQILTYEELNTVLVSIEAILNSRPLVEISSDPHDLSVLTPGHFLTLEPLTALPDHDLTHLQINRLSRWQLLQRMHQHFWQRWHDEYLHSLMQRAKWTKDVGSILNVGKLVLIRDERLPPLKWRLGRIIDVHPGKDGVCRVATVRTSEGVIKRPVVKLCPLPSRE